MHFGVNAYINFGTIVIAVLTRYLNEKIRVEKIKNRFLLQQELENRDSIINDQVNKIMKINDELRVKHYEVEKVRFAKDVYRQVAHDVRSPLMAMEMAVKYFDKDQEQSKSLIRNSAERIKGIADQLLKNSQELFGNKERFEFEELPLEELNCNELLSLIADLIDEKMMIHRQNKSLYFEMDIKDGCENKRCKINRTELIRVLSNLINNSVESVRDFEVGIVKVTIGVTFDNVLIEVKDNGKGMPPELVKSLGEKPLSVDKEDGHGLGLYHAFKTLKAWVGKVSIESAQGAGTKVELKIPIIE